MIDSIDLQIMKELQKNSRQPIRKIGYNLNISYNTVNNRIMKMKEQQIIDKFVTIVNHESFGYKKVYLLISEVNIEQKEKKTERNNHEIFDILNLAGKISEWYICVGQLHSFGILVKDDVEKKINSIRKLLKASITILGIQEPTKTRIDLEKLSETDLKLIYYLVKNPKIQINELAENIEITTKTIKRRLDKLIKNKVISFSTIFKPESIRGYILFHILLRIRHENITEVFEKIRKEHENYFFAHPVLQSRIIFLNLFATNVYELDKRYIEIIHIAGDEIENSWLFIDKYTEIFQVWIFEEINKKINEKRQF
jgi:DNA-binding Lrp family transcriptional regulator